MRLKCQSLLLAAGLCLTASMAPGIDYRIMLSDESVAELPPEARAVYLEAYDNNERANYDAVARILGDAASLAPEHEELQYLALARSRDRAEVYYGTGVYTLPPPNMDYSSPPWHVAEPFYEIAEQSLQRLNNISTLSQEERRRLQREALLVEQGRASIQQRDQARLETALGFVIQMRQARIEARGLQDTMRTPVGQEGPVGAGPGGGTTTIPGEDTDTGGVVDPFELLPGEARDSWLPAPPPPQNQGGGGGRNPFGPPPGGPPNDLGGGPPGGPTGGNPFDDPTGGGAPPPPPPTGGGSPNPFDD